jgi:hypothetical protein
LPDLASNHDIPDLYLPSSWDCGNASPLLDSSSILADCILIDTLFLDFDLSRWDNSTVAEVRIPGPARIWTFLPPWASPSGWHTRYSSLQLSSAKIHWHQPGSGVILATWDKIRDKKDRGLRTAQGNSSRHPISKITRMRCTEDVAEVV